MTESVARCLLDTGVLTRAAHTADPSHAAVRSGLTRLRNDGAAFHFAPQNAVEAWNVLTRPLSSGGYEMTSQQARALLDNCASLFSLLAEDETIHQHWLRLVLDYKVVGRQVHDARLVAAMLAADIKIVVTLNGRDFARYASEGLIAIDPTQL